MRIFQIIDLRTDTIMSYSTQPITIPKHDYGELHLTIECLPKKKLSNYNFITLLLYFNNTLIVRHDIKNFQCLKK